jgi:hypothetical protein
MAGVGEPGRHERKYGGTDTYEAKRLPDREQDQPHNDSNSVYNNVDLRPSRVDHRMGVSGGSGRRLKVDPGRRNSVIQRVSSTWIVLREEVITRSSVIAEGWASSLTVHK